MGLAHSSSIVTNGLVFAYDMGNRQKSFKGAPTINRFTLPEVDVNGFGVQNSTFTRVRTGNFAGYNILPTDYVWRYNISVNDCPYHGWDIPTTIGSVVTFSFDYYIDPSTTGYPSTNYLANFENAGSGVGGAVGDPTPSITGVWKTAYMTSTATATGNSRCLLYPGGCGTRLGTAGFILYRNPQVEFNAPGGLPTPFVAGTRSNTQALLDLTNNNTITATSLTYASDNTFSFNGSAQYATVPSSTIFNPGAGSYTIQTWCNITSASASGWHLLVARRNQGGTGGYYLGVNDTAGGNFMLTNNAGSRTDTQSVGSPSFSYNTWFMLTAILDRSTNTQTLIKNNYETLHTTTPSGGTYENTSAFNIGGDPGSGSFYTVGQVPIVRCYNRALPALEVQQNFNALRGRYGL